MQALPQYAAKHRISQCTGCHVSPSGGGIRNLNGRMYGARGFKPSVLSEQEYLSVDWRMLYYKSEKPQATSEGSTIMAGIVSGSLPLNREKPDLHLVFHQGAGGLLNDRDTYLQAKLSDGPPVGLVQYLQVGRLQIPFGLQTDEHRTYARIASLTSWNDFAMGVGFASNPFESLHYDLLFINGEPSQNPNQLANDKSNKWGGVMNLRWTSASPGWPLMAGVSGMKLDRLQDGPASAASFYFVYSIDRATESRLPLHLSVETVRSHRMNSNNLQLSRMIEANYLQSVSASASQAVLVQLDWELSRRWILTYKFDELLLDYEHWGDFYRRHGAGFRYYFGPNTYVMARYELANSTQPTEAERTKLANQNAFWSVMRLSF